jgi:hypothetical protein
MMSSRIAECCVRLSYVSKQRCLFHQRLHNSLHIELLEVVVALSSAHKQNGLTRRVRHGDGGANFVVNRVKLSQDDAVDCSASEPTSRTKAIPWFVSGREVLHGLRG